MQSRAPLDSSGGSVKDVFLTVIIVQKAKGAKKVRRQLAHWPFRVPEGLVLGSFEGFFPKILLLYHLLLSQHSMDVSGNSKIRKFFKVETNFFYLFGKDKKAYTLFQLISNF